MRATSQADLYTLERDEFLAAMTGHAPSAEAADAAVATRLMELRVRVGSL